MVQHLITTTKERKRGTERRNLKSRNQLVRQQGSHPKRASQALLSKLVNHASVVNVIVIVTNQMTNTNVVIITRDMKKVVMVVTNVKVITATMRAIMNMKVAATTTDITTDSSTSGERNV